MTERMGERSTTGQRRWQRALAGGCACVLLWAAAPANAQAPADAAPGAAAGDTADREKLLRLLAEEMTTRLVNALSIQARSHATEVATLELRLRTTEDRLEKAEAARQQADAAHRDELKDMRELVARAEAAMGGIGASQAAMKAALAAREDDVARLKTALARSLAAVADARAEARAKVAVAPEPDPAVVAEREAVRRQLEDTSALLERARQEAAALAADRDRLRQEKDDAAVLLANLRIDRDLVEGERDALADRLDVVAARAAVPAAPADAPAMASEAIERLGQIEQFLSSTGINVQKLVVPVAASKGAVVPPPLPAARQGGRGGPFIPASAIGMVEQPKATEARLKVDQQHLERLDRIESILRIMPLGAPLQHYSFESGFGPRSDPFRRRAAMHEGVDLAAPMRTPLRVTGGGTVVHAGPKSAYGKTVDVKHANGLVTRYAHMSEIKVAEGATLRRGDVVGLLGSTGRSTGPHVHYEVIVEGKPVDPVRFIGRRK